MTRLGSMSLAVFMAAAMFASVPAQAEPEPKTELVTADGDNVDSLQLRYAFNAAWVVDTQNLLWRDDSRAHYLVTLDAACSQLAQRRAFSFRPSDPWRLDASRTYKVYPYAGRECDVAKIEQVDSAKAETLKATALRRAW